MVTPSFSKAVEIAKELAKEHQTFACILYVGVGWQVELSAIPIAVDFYYVCECGSIKCKSGLHYVNRDSTYNPNIAKSFNFTIEKLNNFFNNYYNE